MADENNALDVQCKRFRLVKWHGDPPRPGEDKTPLVNFTELTGSTLNVQIVYWHFPADSAAFRALNERVNVEILTRFKDEGIDLK